MKDNTLEFYVNKFNCIDNIEDMDLSFIPPIVRRRMSVLDKITISTLNNVFSDDVQNIVFSSQFGEVERLIKIINQYRENNEVSPNTFSGSVHNYPVGFFLFNKQVSIPYNAVSSCENSISMGLLTSVISEYDNKIFCYSDIDDNNAKSFAINLSKNKKNNSAKYLIKVQNNNEIKDNFEDFINLFNGSKNIIETPMYTIERVGL